MSCHPTYGMTQICEAINRVFVGQILTKYWCYCCMNCNVIETVDIAVVLAESHTIVTVAFRASYKFAFTLHLHYVTLHSASRPTHQ